MHGITKYSVDAVRFSTTLFASQALIPKNKAGYKEMVEAHNERV